MAIDYKDISFSFRKKRRKKIFKRIRILLLAGMVLFTIVLVLRNIQAGKLQKVQSLILESNLTEAVTLLNKSSSSIFQREAWNECQALIHLFQNQIPSADKILQNLKFKNKTIMRKKFLDFFSDTAEYKKLEFYTGHLSAKNKNVKIYQIISNTALYSPEKAASLMGELGSKERLEHAKKLDIIKQVNSQVLNNKVECFFDINGKTIASYNPRKKKISPHIPGFDFEKFTPSLEEGVRYYKFSLDSKTQLKIHQLFEKKHGSFILMRLQDSSIMAAYSKPIDSHPGNAAFTRRYQPGSIIKIITLFGYLSHSKKQEFSVFCRGSKNLSGKIFYDWRPHNVVGSYHQALAISCNISFAEMANRIGLSKLKETFDGFLFNRESLSDGPLLFHMGKYKKQGFNDYQMARLSVGLDEISITTVHAAILASFFSQNGTIYAPHIIQNQKNILQLGYYNHQSRFIQAKKNNNVYSNIQKAMLQVSESRDGTGNLAKVDFTSVALKTGTTGGRPLGFHSVLIGYYPATKPEYAFAFRLERGGKASPEGSRFLKKFLLSFFDQSKNPSSI